MSENSQDSTIGNQQERLFFDIGYLLGIIDGEGSYQIAAKYKYKDYINYNPRISIYNNNPAILKQVTNILEKLEVSFLIWQPALHGREKAIGYRIEISGLQRVKKFTDILLQYPSGKKDRIQVINDFCNYRLAFSKNKGKNETYSEKTLVYKAELNKLNAMYRGTKSSETIRSDATA